MYGADLLRISLHVFTERFSFLSAGRSLAWQSWQEGAGDLLRQVGGDGGDGDQHQHHHQPHGDSHAGTTFLTFLTGRKLNQVEVVSII